MTAWTTGQRIAPGSWVAPDDLAGLAEALNRRRLLVGQPARTYPRPAAGLWVGSAEDHDTVSSMYSPFRYDLNVTIAEPAPGPLGPSPGNPRAVDWLHTDGRRIVTDGPVGAEEVLLASLLNGTDTWTDPVIQTGRTWARADHVNELRHAVELLVRGRWRLRVILGSGLYEGQPDMHWAGGYLYAGSGHEIRCVAWPLLYDPPRGLHDVTIGAGSYLELAVSEPCTVRVYRCLRPVDMPNTPCTWNSWGGGDWGEPGGLGGADAQMIGTVSCTPEGPNRLAGVGGAFQAMVDGAPQYLTFARSDESAQSVAFSAEAVLEFTLNQPPM